MKLSKSNIVFYFLILATIGLLHNSCKNKKQEIPPYVSVTLEVKDENKQPVPSATAYLYSSPEAYAAAYNKSLQGVYDGSGSMLTGYVTNGQLVFPQIPSNQPYWILIHDDSQKFKNEKGGSIDIPIHRDNTGANFYIDKFQNGTDIFANIKLEPVNALVKIIPSTSNTILNVIDIKNRYEEGKIIPGDYIQVRKGSVPFFARDKICIWTGDVDAVGGILTVKTLESCAQAGIVFKYSGILASDSILIFLGQNKSKPVAVLKQSKLLDTVYVGTQPNYTYFAQKSNGIKCVWEDKISPSGGDSLLTVKLNNCQ